MEWSLVHIIYSAIFVLEVTTTTFEVKLTSPQYRLGGLLQIRCEVDPRITVTRVIYYKGKTQDQYVFVWIKGDKNNTKPLGAYKSRKINHLTNETLGTFDLLLWKPQLLDEGTYWCHLYGNTSDDWGIQSGNVSLAVSPVTGPLINVPAIHTTSSSTCENASVHTLSNYSKIQVICHTFQSRPPTNITWFINGEQRIGRNTPTDPEEGLSNVSSVTEIEIGIKTRVKCYAIVPSGNKSQPFHEWSVCIYLQAPPSQHEQNTALIVSIPVVVIFVGLALLVFLGIKYRKLKRLGGEKNQVCESSQHREEIALYKGQPCREYQQESSSA